MKPWTQLESDRKCVNCEKTETLNTELKNCSRCKTVEYCSRECQKADWPRHKYICRERKMGLAPVVGPTMSSDAGSTEVLDEREEAWKMLERIAAETEHDPEIRSDADIYLEESLRQMKADKMRAGIEQNFSKPSRTVATGEQKMQGGRRRKSTEGKSIEKANFEGSVADRDKPEKKGTLVEQGPMIAHSSPPQMQNIIQDNRNQGLSSTVVGGKCELFAERSIPCEADDPLFKSRLVWDPVGHAEHIEDRKNASATAEMLKKVVPIHLVQRDQSTKQECSTTSSSTRPNGISLIRNTLLDGACGKNRREMESTTRGATASIAVFDQEKSSIRDSTCSTTGSGGRKELSPPQGKQEDEFSPGALLTEIGEPSSDSEDSDCISPGGDLRAFSEPSSDSDVA
ncbi:unnamed protein product [Amoebophrya sp. A25]|nr:unnamed protein product [Amoebophrya sp. A25]|eukprot:GSA25T00023583001.1